jgi:lysophospholipase L1-like esterase
MTTSIVALGDSISAGVGDAVGPECTHGPGWAAHLATLLRAAEFRNLACNGARASHVVDVQLPSALDLRPRLATLVVGGNDALRNEFSPASVGRDLSIAVSALRDVGATVVLATLPPIALFELAPAPVRHVMRDRIDAVNTAVRQVAAGAGADAVLFDVAAATRAAGTRAWHVDRVHPSPHGHRVLAVAAARALARSLPELSGPGLGIPVHGPDYSELLRALPPSPAPPSVAARVAWLTAAGIPWAVRRGHDFLPGLARAVVANRATDAVRPASAVAGA